MGFFGTDALVEQKGRKVRKSEGVGRSVRHTNGWVKMIRMSSLTGTDETLTCRGYGGTFVTLWRA